MEANGMSDIEGKAARVAANERGAVSESQLTGLKGSDRDRHRRYTEAPPASLPPPGTAPPPRPPPPAILPNSPSRSALVSPPLRPTPPRPLALSHALTLPPPS